ncbi:hypothetical protein O3M35_004085 [Rhynocoris fuscipes]|uniref:Uncharacterized protein n=1 Tax=Rhynocoris fuscipes TaxID=488301 RepID=A0AAW1CL35_9HEMI
MDSIKNGIKTIKEFNNKKLNGIEVDINNRKLFIVGQFICNEFIPGQTVHTSNGLKFIPGIVTKTENGIKLMPGFIIEIDNKSEFIAGQLTLTNKGEKFVQGQTIITENGNKFIPGQTVKQNNSIKFIPGQIFDDRFIPGQIFTTDDGLEFIPGQTIETNMKNEFIAGISMWSENGWEFLPGEAKSLPKGKVVSGKLIRGKDMKFIPGKMIDGKFIPGQIVITDDGEQFIPGQVIETEEGPKFVPGQIIHTKNGDKFVPGQTIKTENGPKFIPGQIIETKVGPTFIPGQVIHTDDGLIKFIPGEVVDTCEGPRFVPGKVIETGDCITFIPGQIVQTNDGLKFIAPDLINEEDDLEFTLQGFDISPEELHLLQPKGSNIGTGDMIIDSHMLKQLSEAGMGIGNEISAEIPEVSVRSAPAMSAACILGQKLKLDPVTTVKLSQIIAGIVKIGKLGEIQGTTEEVQTMNRILERVVHCKNDEEAYKLISNIIEKEFSANIVKDVDQLHAYLVSAESPLKRLNKINIMKEILNCNLTNSEVLEKLILIMDEEDDTVCSALNRIHQVQPEIVSYIIERFMETVGKLENEKDVIDTLHKSIVSSVRHASEMCIVDLMKDTENLALRTLILDAVSLAKALDMQETAVTLLGLLSNPKCANILAGDRIILEILRKLTVMKKLAEKKPEFLTALKQLNLDPYQARTDPNLVQLAKESQALLVIPEEGSLESSVSVPTSLLFSQNSLAMEEYLSRRKRVYRILVIIKNGIQAIIPREASHSVLTGSVPYAVLDEKGLHYFQPKHVFTALKLPNICKNWFSLYKCEYKDITTQLNTPAH